MKRGFLNQVISALPDCISNEVKHYIACQFALESNFGRSAFASTMSNYCGMKVPSLRLSTAVNLDKKGEFAKYSSFYQCIVDYLLWLQYNKFRRGELNDLVLFKNKLDIACYCNDLGYFDRIDSLYKQYF